MRTIFARRGTALATAVVTVAAGVVAVLPAGGTSAAAAVPSCATTEQSFLGDWNGDGVDTPGVRRGNVLLTSDTNTSSVTTSSAGFGNAADTAIVGDWDGDGIDTVGVKQAGSNNYVLQVAPGSAQKINFAWGRATDVPIAGDWDGDGIDTIGLFRAPGQFILAAGPHQNGVGPAQYASFPYGRSTDQPIVGDWTGTGKDSVGIRRPLEGNETRADWYFRDGVGVDAGAARGHTTYGLWCDSGLTGHFTAGGASEIAARRDLSWFHEGSPSLAGFYFPLPELLVGKNQLDRAAAMVAAGTQPYARSYGAMLSTLKTRERTVHGACDVRQGTAPEPGQPDNRPIKHLVPGPQTGVPVVYQGRDYACYYAQGTQEAIVARDLAIMIRIGDPAHQANQAAMFPDCPAGSTFVQCATAELKTLLVDTWADDPNLSATIADQSRYDDGQPKTDGPTAGALVQARVMTVFADAYAIAYDVFDGTQRSTIESWLRTLRGQIRTGQQAYWDKVVNGERHNGAEYYANHPMSYVMGEFAISTVLDDVDDVNFVLTGSDNEDKLQKMVNGALLPANASDSDLFRCDPAVAVKRTNGLDECRLKHDGTFAPPYQATAKGEVYDRYRSYGNSLDKPGNHGPAGVVYASLTLRFMTFLALIGRNSGWAPNVLYGPTTEKLVTLSDAFTFYAPFYKASPDPRNPQTIGSGYYRNDRYIDPTTKSPGPLWEIANEAFRPGGSASPQVTAMIGRMDASSSAPFDIESLGYSAALLYRPAA